MSFVLVHYKPEPCFIGRVRGVTKLFVQPLSDSQVLVVWSKILGSGFRYRIRANVSNVVVRELTGATSFGSVQAYVVNGLQPKTDYTVSAQHECESNPGVYSKEKIYSKTITTLTRGKCRLYLYFSLFLVPNFHIFLLKGAIIIKRVTPLLRNLNLSWHGQSVIVRLYFAY